MLETMTKYTMVKSKVEVEDYGKIITYGLKATNLFKNILIKDISTISEKVYKFVDLCNNNGVSLIILDDVLEDYIS